MKQIKIALVTLFGVLALGVNAQEITVKGGLNFDNLYGKNVDTDMKVGFHVGALVGFSLNDSFSVQPGLEFTTMGNKKGDFSQNINALSIPVLGKMAIPLGMGDTNMYLNAGPYMDILFGGTIKNGGNSQDIKVEKGGLKRLAFGLNLGAGVEFGSLLVGLGYDFGLSGISDISDSATARSLKLSVGYKFGM